MAAKTGTYTLISSTTLSTAAASVTFSSIPGTYTDLILVANVAASSAGTFSSTLRFNSDSASNYSDTRMIGNGSTASSNRDSNQTEMYPANITNGIGTVIHQIMDYSNATTFKTVISRGISADYEIWTNVGLWRKTPEAITSILLSVSGSNWASGSNFKLYGIEAGNL
jgi:hypothetical protein